jgi:hypothetical protein
MVPCIGQLLILCGEAEMWSWEDWIFSSGQMSTTWKNTGRSAAQVPASIPRPGELPAAVALGHEQEAPPPGPHFFKDLLRSGDKLKREVLERPCAVQSSFRRRSA